LPVLRRRYDEIDRAAALFCLKFELMKAVDRRPRRSTWPSATKNQAITELRHLAKLSDDIYHHISRMRNPAILALQDTTPAGPAQLRDLKWHVWDMCAAARYAIDHLKKSDEPRIRGKPQARAVTDAAAKIYQELTGEAPGRISSGVEINGHVRGQREGGPFVEFLADTFEALGIDAKAAGQAKLLSKRRGARQARRVG
jgi:hypothetical protein